MELSYWIVAIPRDPAAQPMHYGPYDDESEALGDCNLGKDDAFFKHAYVVGEPS